MDQQPPKRPHPNPIPVTVSGKRALADARDLVLKAAADQRVADQTPEAPKSKGPFRLASGLVIAASVAILVFQPAWLFPPPPPPETSAVAEASLRMVIFREAQRIEAYRRVHHELPQTAVAAGGGSSGVTYHPLDAERYTLTGSNGPMQLSYSSTDSLGSFLGNSYEIIRHRTRQ